MSPPTRLSLPRTWASNLGKPKTHASDEDQDRSHGAAGPAGAASSTSTVNNDNGCALPVSTFFTVPAIRIGSAVGSPNKHACPVSTFFTVPAIRIGDAAPGRRVYGRAPRVNALLLVIAIGISQAASFDRCVAA